MYERKGGGGRGGKNNCIFAARVTGALLWLLSGRSINFPCPASNYSHEKILSCINFFEAFQLVDFYSNQ